MRKISMAIFIVFLVFVITDPSYAANLRKSMYNALGAGYRAASEGGRIQSKKYFYKAFDFAKKCGDWSVMIDAAGGILVLGDRHEAVECFEQVEKLNKKLKDWRASVALGYNYLALPKSFIDNDCARKNAELAEKFAFKRKDWRGLLEAAKLFDMLKLAAFSLDSLEKAKFMAVESMNGEAMIEIAHYYDKKGYSEKAREITKLAERYENEKRQIESHLPEPEEEYYATYDSYYDYPYFYRYYYVYGNITYLPPDWLCDWARFHLNRYKLTEGNYVPPER